VNLTDNFNLIIGANIAIDDETRMTSIGEYPATGSSDLPIHDCCKHDLAVRVSLADSLRNGMDSGQGENSADCPMPSEFYFQAASPGTVYSMFLCWLDEWMSLKGQYRRGK
jgi:hypothetical protein